MRRVTLLLAVCLMVLAMPAVAGADIDVSLEVEPLERELVFTIPSDSNEGAIWLGWGGRDSGPSFTLSYSGRSPLLAALGRSLNDKFNCVASGEKTTTC